MNVFTGANGAGKTSFLEAIFFLGRGRSFRTADNRNLVQSGAASAQLTGRSQGMGRTIQLGVRIGPPGLEIHVDGQAGGSTADLISALAVQAIDAEVGDLVQGAPDARRRLLDWGVFHVKHDYLGLWRQFRRALLQRNVVLRENGPDSLIEAWDGELATAGEAIDRHRTAYLAELVPQFIGIGGRVLGAEVGLGYYRGWPEGKELRACLREGREGDRSMGYTRHGPQRADLQIQMNDERSRWRASKGEQKLLGSALVLAECALVAGQGGQAVALIVDEPAADLDATRLATLMRAVMEIPAQVFLASISVDPLTLENSVAMFHVEHGHAKALL